MVTDFWRYNRVGADQASIFPEFHLQGLRQWVPRGRGTLPVLSDGHLYAFGGKCPQHPFEAVQLGSCLKVAKGT